MLSKVRNLEVSGADRALIGSGGSGGSRIFRCFVANGGAHILFSGKKCMKLK